jgi:23S rRNA pseudouridine1911/1915/1917 synthase
MKPFGSDNIVLCDNHILVVDKPAEVATQPDLTELARAWVKQKFNKPGRVFLEPIHRLDKPVSGLVLFARTSKALSRLQEQMRERHIEKIYEAWVEGSPKAMTGMLRHHLLHGAFRAEVSPQGKEAILEYQVLKQEKNRAHLRLVLHTGRYHQIRAQLSAIGCPILGDTKYGSRVPWPHGIALRASELSFKHPVTKTLINVKGKIQAF